MRNISLIIVTSVRNNLQLKYVTIIFIVLTLMIVAGIALSICLLLIAPAMDVESPDRNKLELYLGLIMYCTCLVGLGINLNSFAMQSMVREKSRGNIQSLLATTLEVKDIWIAKSLALFIPGLVMGEVLTFIVLIVVNYIYFVPIVGFLFNPWIAISSFLIVPLIYLCLGLLVHLIGLTGKPANGNVIAQIFLPIATTLMINLSVHNILDITSWSFALGNTGIIAIFAIIVFVLQFRLTKERIILSH